VLRPIEWLPQGRVRFLDQTLLPAEERWIETDDYNVIAEAIRGLRVRGAPLIGIAAAYGLALAVQREGASGPSALRQAATVLLATRPTAVNLAWAVQRMLAAAERAKDASELRAALEAEAIRIHEEDIEANRRIGEAGAALLPAGCAVLTHCNAGSLATGGYGTALGIIRSAYAQGKLSRVYHTETRPLLQGARLTAWELQREGIPATLIPDGATGIIMRRGLVQAVVVGADRIAANGDVANKVGTYPIALLAREHGIPFYVAAPTSTLDLSLANGDLIPIEERSPEEVTSVGGRRVAPPSVEAANPAFDVTPAGLISAIVTENGVASPPCEATLSVVASRSEVTARG
jgi:methylthioribose-1-phosphate isomerase